MEKVVEGSVDNFLTAVKVYYEHPNCANKQVILSQHIYGGKIESSFSKGENGHDEIINSALCKITENLNFNLKDIGISNVIRTFFTNIKEIENLESIFDYGNDVFLLIRKLIPKKIINNMELIEIWLLGLYLFSRVV